MTNNKTKPDPVQPDYDKILDELHLLQKELLPAKGNNQSGGRPQEPSNIEVDSLKISILTESLDQEIDRLHKAHRVFDEAQHHLFGKADDESVADEGMINTTVSKLIARMRPQIEQLLREKIRAKVIERFNREN